MPAPTSTTELIDLVRRSGVVEDDRLTAYLEPLVASGSVPSEPTKFAGLMVREGLLTLFQAEQFLQGKWKRFHIGKYKVLERLGSGGMAQVFLCEHKVMRRRVAVKVLPSARAGDPAARERFYREARAVAALDHPNLVRAFDIDQDASLHFLVMEFVDGASLHDIVKKHGPMDPLRAGHYLRQAADGLDYANRVAGLVHRDIKPGNILVDRAGVVKVLDMGLARFFQDESDVLTHKYDENVLGTADYLAPEQALDSHSVDVRADIYSLGATFYFVLTGRPPFPDGSAAQKLIWHQSRQPKSINELRAEVPGDFVAIIERMMRKAPGERFQTPAELASALAPLTAVPIPPPPEREMPLLSLAAMTGGPAPPASAVQTRSGGRTSTIRRIPAAHESSRSTVTTKPQLDASGLVATPIPGATPRPVPPSEPAPAPPSVPRANPFASLMGGRGHAGPTVAGMNALESVYATESGMVSRPVLRSGRSYRWVFALVAGAVTVALAAAAAWFRLQHRW
jgi:serine/threonine protein kinase